MCQYIVLISIWYTLHWWGYTIIIHYSFFDNWLIIDLICGTHRVCNTNSDINNYLVHIRFKSNGQNNQERIESSLWLSPRREHNPNTRRCILRIEHSVPLLAETCVLASLLELELRGTFLHHCYSRTNERIRGDSIDNHVEFDWEHTFAILAHACKGHFKATAHAHVVLVSSWCNGSNYVYQ